MFTERDHHFMQQALKLAELAQQKGEVPVGAVVVVDNEIVGVGANCPIESHDPTAHAEMIALRDAGLKLSNYRLPNASLYVTLEPCMMCAGALIHARIDRLCFAAREPKAGAIVSKAEMLSQTFVNHRVSIAEGLLSEQSSILLSRFFQIRRSA